MNNVTKLLVEYAFYRKEKDLPVFGEWCRTELRGQTDWYSAREAAFDWWADGGSGVPYHVTGIGLVKVIHTPDDDDRATATFSGFYPLVISFSDPSGEEVLYKVDAKYTSHEGLSYWGYEFERVVKKTKEITVYDPVRETHTDTIDPLS